MKLFEKFLGRFTYPIYVHFLNMPFKFDRYFFPKTHFNDVYFMKYACLKCVFHVWTFLLNLGIGGTFFLIVVYGALLLNL